MTTRRGFRAFLMAAACVAFAASCGSAAAALRLELKLDKGKTWYERMVLDQKITQDILGQQQVTNMVIGTTMKLEVLDVDGQGNMQIRHTYASTRFKQANPMMPAVDYDSSRQAIAPAGAEGFAALVGQSYAMKISPKGQVLEVTGMEELAEAIRKKLPGGAPAQGTDPLWAFLDKDALKEMTENSLAVYPGKPVEPGDSWTRKQSMRRSLAMTTESKWMLQKRDAGVATIASTASMKTDPNGPAMEIQGMAMKMDLSGSQEGTIQMQESTGLVLVNRGRQQLKGQIRVGSSPQGPFDMMAIPMTLETAFTTETSDKMWETKPQ